jgi:NAD(P)-dependent dehydrogenase (short-subunit alcohol dehydrogenase family)
MNRLKDKVAIVTGGALGLGRATALLMAREGAKVVVTDLREADGASAVAEIEKAGGAASFFQHNVSLEDDWIKVVDGAMAKYGRLDVVVNNAGIATPGNAEDALLADWRKVISVNLDGVFLGTKHGIRGIKQFKRGGAIINLSSIEGLVGDPDLAAYNASKGGVRLLTKSAALHCAKTGTGIRVNSIHPGFVWTPMVENAPGDADAKRKALVALHPVGHLGEPEDIGWGVVYLASDEAKFVTGSELVIDGGYTAQ